MEATALYGDVADLLAADDEVSGRRLLELADSEWSAMSARAVTPHDAETCRLVSLAAAKLGELSAVAQWRARALSRFASIGWTEGVAALLVGSAFIELGRVNDDYPQGQFLDVIKPAGAAIPILEAAETCFAERLSGISVGAYSPSPDLIARFVHEKRGFLLLVEGQYGEARTSYERALEVVGSSIRGRTKVLLGVELLTYVEAIRGGTAASARPTEELMVQAKAIGELNLTDLINIAQFNIVQMRAGTLHLKPYEIL